MLLQKSFLKVEEVIESVKAEDYGFDSEAKKEKRQKRHKQNQKQNRGMKLNQKLNQEFPLQLKILTGIPLRVKNFVIHQNIKSMNLFMMKHFQLLQLTKW